MDLLSDVVNPKTENVFRVIAILKYFILFDLIYLEKKHDLSPECNNINLHRKLRVTTFCFLINPIVIERRYGFLATNPIEGLSVKHAR